MNDETKTLYEMGLRASGVSDDEIRTELAQVIESEGDSEDVVEAAEIAGFKFTREISEANQETVGRLIADNHVVLEGMIVATIDNLEDNTLVTDSLVHLVNAIGESDTTSLYSLVNVYGNYLKRQSLNRFGVRPMNGLTKETGAYSRVVMTLAKSHDNKISFTNSEGETSEVKYADIVMMPFNKSDLVLAANCILNNVKAVKLDNFSNDRIKTLKKFVTKLNASRNG